MSIDFKNGRTVSIHQVRVQFQAGFVAESGSLQIQMENGSWETAQELEFEDTYELQTCKLDEIISTAPAIKLVFEDFSDFYGRVTIYRLEIWGTEL